MPTPPYVPLVVATLVAAAPPARAQGAPDAAADSAPRAAAPWHERVTLRGYVQVRYNRLAESNPLLVCTQCDRSIGPNGGIFIRRARVSIVAKVNRRVTLTFQPDFTAEASETNGGIAQVRDAFAEVALDPRQHVRLRLGQTNTPFGFENLLSSAKRVPFDRADALNSAAPTERDLGAFLFWSPRVARARYLALAEGVGKGPGDFGVVSVGVYNGQTANRSEQNGNLHAGARVAYPFAIGGGQLLEGAVQGYAGRFVVPATQRTADTGRDEEFADQRAAVSLVLHPRPVGVQVEWTRGRGPEADPAARAIRTRALQGGYAQAMVQTRVRGQLVTPYARAQRYDGGKKFETDARRHRVRELEVGTEWMLSPEVELTAAFLAGERETADLATADGPQKGRRVRVQAQFSF